MQSINERIQTMLLEPDFPGTVPQSFLNSSNEKMTESSISSLESLVTQLIRLKEKLPPEEHTSMWPKRYPQTPFSFSMPTSFTPTTTSGLWARLGNGIGKVDPRLGICLSNDMSGSRRNRPNRFSLRKWLAVIGTCLMLAFGRIQKA